MQPNNDTLECILLFAKYPGYGFSTPLNCIFEVWDLRCRKCFRKNKILPGLQYHVGLVVLTERASQPGEGDKKKKICVSFEERIVRKALFCCKPPYFLTGYVCSASKHTRRQLLLIKLLTEELKP